MPGAVVIGAGPGIGRSVAVRFAEEGLPLAVLARKAATVDALAAEIPGALPLTADVADETALRSALEAAVAHLGTPDAVVYNAAVIRSDAPGELSTRDHLATYAVNVLGALTAAAYVLPAMARRGSGTFLVTGGMPAPVPAYTSLSLGKAGVRSLVALLDTEYGPSGVHVATVTVAGAVAAGTAFDPDDIAGHYWRLHAQPRPGWEREYVYGGLVLP